MKKKIVIILVLIIIAYILLWPSEGKYRDGGSVIYSTVLYSVKFQNSYDYGSPPSDILIGRNIGTVVTIFGIEVYNDVHFVTIEEYNNGDY